MYKCSCGKEFESINSLNAHKSRCKVHLGEEKYNLYVSKDKERLKKSNEKKIEKLNLTKKNKLEQWISEKHTCEYCGKIMTEYYGSGRFCCRACSNGWVSKNQDAETKAKKVEGGKQNLELGRKKKEKTIINKHKKKDKIIKKEKTCVICGQAVSSANTSGYCRECSINKKRNEYIEEFKNGKLTSFKIPKTIREYILETQNHKCAICGLPTVWNGKPLVFIADHIDGDASNSIPSNLRLICPNCDSQLDTYKSKNKNSARKFRKKYYNPIFSKDSEEN